ncbi:MAG: hypothetical protein CR974_01700 [Gammaproteobacteria bacterium]|nr:MAG: hypothetical protein CR974_01700 [Gammaproteobacteria bacterium]
MNVYQELNQGISTYEDYSLLCADNLLWKKSSKKNTEGSYQSYLNQFPQGKFAVLAYNKQQEFQQQREELQRKKEQAKRKEIERRNKEEELLWEKIVEENTEVGYQNYLNQYPNGRFATLAYNAQQKLQQQREELQRKKEQAKRKETERRKKEEKLKLFFEIKSRIETYSLHEAILANAMAIVWCLFIILALIYGSDRSILARAMQGIFIGFCLALFVVYKLLDFVISGMLKDELEPPPFSFVHKTDYLGEDDVFYRTGEKNNRICHINVYSFCPNENYKPIKEYKLLGFGHKTFYINFESVCDLCTI